MTAGEGTWSASGQGRTTVYLVRTTSCMSLGTEDILTGLRAPPRQGLARGFGLEMNTAAVCALAAKGQQDGTAGF